MRNIGRWLMVGVAGIWCLPALVDAHFVLLEPASWIVEAKNGDPQKLGPCGGTSADPGTPSNAIGKMRGNDTIHIKVQETVFHPGHYRVALVKSRADLPEDPAATTEESDRGPRSVSALIQSPAKAPVLADGLFVHTERPAPGQAQFWETDLQLPNINCEKCTLQVVEFMAQHGYNKDGGYTYHHCADLQITADSSKLLDTRWAK